MTILTSIIVVRTFGFMVFQRLAEKKDDGEDVFFQIAEELNIELNEWDIQRCHCLGKKIVLQR